MNNKNVISLLVFLAALVLAVYAFSLVTPIVGDYFSFFRPTTIAFLRGDSNLYDAQSFGFLNAPWALAIWIPFVGFPYWVGQSAHVLLYLSFVIISLALLRKDVPLIGVVFAVFNIPAFILMVAAGIDSFVLLGIALAFVATLRRHAGLLSVALFILATKPQNVALVALVCLYASRDWKATWLTIGAAVVSGLFVGLDWPLRYISYMQTWPPLIERRVELWAFLPPVMLVAAAVFALAALVYLLRRDGFNEWTFSLALTTNLVFSPYVLFAHFVLLIPALLFIARRNWRLALVPWLASWLLLFSPPNIPWFGMLYPISVFALLWVIVLRQHRAGIGRVWAVR